MNKVFYVLLFLSISGIGVLWWLLQSLPPEDRTSVESVTTGLKIEDDKKVDSPGAVAKTETKVETPKTSEVKSAAESKKETSPKEKSAEIPTETNENDATSLSIETIPTGALLYVDGLLKGKAPVTIKVAAGDKLLKVELEGYEKLEKRLDLNNREKGAMLHWKLDLKPLTAAAKETKFEQSDYRLIGSKGPFFIQLKAVAKDPSNSWLVGVQNYRDKVSGMKIFACDVDLGAKGRWTRFLAGPFDSRSLADQALAKARTGSGEKDAFVTGEQSCLE